MKFPISQGIEPLPFGRLTGAVLKIDGNAGQIPPAFQFAVLTSADDGSKLCQQGNSPMTDEQWDAWKDQENAAYILECVAANEGFVLVGDPIVEAAAAPEPEPEPDAPARKSRRR